MGNDVISHVSTLAKRRQEIQDQLNMSPTMEATAQLTTHMLDIVASQNGDLSADDGRQATAATLSRFGAKVVERPGEQHCAKRRCKAQLDQRARGLRCDRSVRRQCWGSEPSANFS